MQMRYPKTPHSIAEDPQRNRSAVKVSVGNCVYGDHSEFDIKFILHFAKETENAPGSNRDNAGP